MAFPPLAFTPCPGEKIVTLFLSSQVKVGHESAAEQTEVDIFVIGTTRMLSWWRFSFHRLARVAAVQLPLSKPSDMIQSMLLHYSLGLLFFGDRLGNLPVFDVIDLLQQEGTTLFQRARQSPVRLQCRLPVFLCR